MVTKRASEIKPFIVMEVLEKANAMEREGINVIHMEVGEPDFDTPQCIKDAVKKAVEDGYTHYTHSLGDFELRKAISNHYKTTYHAMCSPDRIVVTSGTSPAMFLLFSALIEEDDEVILSDPHYACYPNFINYMGGKPVKVTVHAEDGFQLDLDAVKKKITKKTKAILVNSPSNPTGNHLSKERLKAIAELAEAAHLHVISDEIYHGLTYEGQDHSILEFTDRAFVLNGFSKLYAMTGLRLGYLMAPTEFIRPMQKLHQNFFISANSAVQIAGITALEKAGDDILRMRGIYNERRLFLIQRLKELGFKIPKEPTGAFYVFANAKHLSGNSLKLAFDILEKAHLGVTPGIDFGDNGEGYLRFSYANSIENLREGMNRLEAYLKNEYHIG
ncbi:MAG: pyridoxal phosphate-dependent aminotransferase [Proteobacteria bacterium]|nr:pyridoxal phosphate-dependent aminotransferase [Pseudomonadota bacterium]